MRLGLKDLPAYFNGRKQNIGALTGVPYNLTDVDLDGQEALWAWPPFAPETAMVFGRRSKPASHYFYRSDPAIQLIQLKDPLRVKDEDAADDDRSMLIELRSFKKNGSVGLLTLVPPSVHPCGERYEFVRGLNGEPANVDADQLVVAVYRSAACALLGRYAPAPKGGRHDFFLALSGAPAHAQWKIEDARCVVRAVYRVLWQVSADLGKADTEVETSFRRYDDGHEVTGLPHLKQVLHADVFKTAVEWLGLRRNERPLSDSDVPPEYQSTNGHAPETEPPPARPRDRSWVTNGPEERQSRVEADPTPSAPAWPDPLHADAFHGVAGQLVRAIEPHSEADPAALLAQFLVGWGSLVSRGPYYLAEADHHHANEYVCIVGTTSKARKGTSWGRVQVPLGEVDEAWAENCQIFGLGSGEALIDAVREDKRALVHEGEFARLLAVIAREGSTISSMLRTAWDTGTIAIRTRGKKKEQETGAHISLIGHITRDELLRRLSDTEVGNGFGNRHLWMCAKRSKKLSRGGGSIDFGDLIERLRVVTQVVRRLGSTTRVDFDEKAGKLWDEIYGDLSEGRPGMLGSMVSRAEAHVVRLALTYALLDAKEGVKVCIQIEHLKAGLAVWKYAEASARYIWGDSLGDPTADATLEALQATGAAGMTKWDIHNHFSRHKPAAEIDRAINVLLERGLIRFASEKTEGRPVTRYWAL
jgi:hypothetical protein